MGRRAGSAAGKARNPKHGPQCGKARNPKHEIRNNTESRRRNVERAAALAERTPFRHFLISVSELVSDFVLRASDLRAKALLKSPPPEGTYPRAASTLSTN